MSERVRARRHSSCSCGCVSTFRTHLACWLTPPKPQYQPAALLDCIEAGVDAMTVACPSATIVLAHASFIEYASALNIELDINHDAQTNFDIMYSVVVDLPNKFFPEREITVTSSDHPYCQAAVAAQEPSDARRPH